MKLEDLKPNKLLRGPLFAEPVEVIVTVPMGAAVKLMGRGVQTDRWWTVAGEVALTTNEYNTAKRLKKDYWLYVVFHCATKPSLNVIQDPSILDWQPILKIEHYRLKQDSIKHPVQLKEDPIPYRARPSDSSCHPLPRITNELPQAPCRNRPARSHDTCPNPHRQIQSVA